MVLLSSLLDGFSLTMCSFCLIYLLIDFPGLKSKQAHDAVYVCILTGMRMVVAGEVAGLGMAAGADHPRCHTQGKASLSADRQASVSALFLREHQNQADARVKAMCLAQSLTCCTTSSGHLWLWAASSLPSSMSEVC